MRATVETLRSRPRPDRATWRFCGGHAATFAPIVNGKASVFEVIGDFDCDACLIAQEVE